MRNRFITYRAVSFAVVLTIAGAGARADDAPAVSDGFTVSLPAGYAAFTKQVQTAKAPEGEIETTNWISRAPTGEAVVVTSSRMPGKILDPQKLIASTRASLLQSLKATLESEEPRAGDVPSTRMLFRSDAAYFRARLTVVDDRLYQLLYVGRSADQRAAPTVGEMFDSFRLTGTIASPPLVPVRRNESNISPTVGAAR
ncbi:MAG TPA: hypothetical protein VHL59_01085 [Thermoanaerobaculia bacterium]|nr:hypothetical protein [Thermoanaerobaculia bacterium]